MRLVDRQARTKRKLRVSLTDRCNFRCLYCLPQQPHWVPRAELLSDAERFRLLRLFVVEGGIEELRLTGGEPLMRPDLEARVREFASLREGGLSRIALTTNGHWLAERAAGLKAAGVDDLNVSLDAVTPEGFLRLTGGKGEVGRVLDGARAARDAGLPVKLNAVVLRGLNEDELVPLARWACAENLPLRLIEFMPLDGGREWSRERVVDEAEMLARLRTAFDVEAESEPADGQVEPARYYRLDGRYRLGVISTISRPFCSRCDRLRLTADGSLYACLFSERGRDLRSLMRSGADDAELLAAIRNQVWNKESGYAASGYVERPISMHALGG